MRALGTVLSGFCAFLALIAAGMLANGAAACASPSTARVLAVLLVVAGSAVAALTVWSYTRRGAVLVLAGQGVGTVICVALATMLGGATSC